MRDKTILVTGGTGSLGQTICQRLFQEHSPRMVIILSNDEHGQHRLRTQVFPRDRWPVEYVCADVAYFEAVLMATMHVDYVIHAAAMKHVHICESDPEMAIRTNIQGTVNLRRACILNDVKKCVVVSSDKAIHPIGVYGTSKAAADMSVLTRNHRTLFSVVRFGNFWRSAGSMFDTWDTLWAKGVKRLPITDARATRFFISLDAAAAFVLHWLDLCRGGEIVAPKMRSRRVVDVAWEEYPGCEFELIGIRRGEKLHEQLVTPEWSYRTREFPEFFVTDFLGQWQGEGTPVPEGFCYGSEDACQSS